MAFTPYNFPDTPFDGQLYPYPAVPGTFQYKWDLTKGVWVLVSGAVLQVLGNEPIVVTGTAAVPVVNIRPASATRDGYLSAADKQKLDSLPVSIGTVSQVNTGVGLTGGPITSSGTIRLVPPNGGQIGGVKAGTGVTILPDGTIESNAGVTAITAGPGLGGGTITGTGTIFLRPPTGGNIGGVRAGNNITISSDGTISASGGEGATGAFLILDDISPQFDGIKTQFTCRVNGGVQQVDTPANLFIILGGILQPSPATFIVVNNEDLRFVSAPPTGTTFSGRLFVPNGQSFQIIEDISSQFNGVNTTFPLRVGGQPYQPASPAPLFVAVGGVLQTPYAAFTTSGTNIIFTSPPPAGATFSGQVLGF